MKFDKFQILFMCEKSFCVGFALLVESWCYRENRIFSFNFV